MYIVECKQPGQPAQRYKPCGTPITAQGAHKGPPKPPWWQRALDRLLRVPFMLMPPEELYLPWQPGQMT